MGYYTELYLHCKFKSNLPTEIEDVLKFLFDTTQDRKLPKLPKHPLFKTERWPVIGRMTGNNYSAVSQLYFFESTRRPESSRYELTTRFDIKNYGDEIREFLDWIKPHINNDYDDNLHLGHIKTEDGDIWLVYYANSEILYIPVDVPLEQ